MLKWAIDWLRTIIFLQLHIKLRLQKQFIFLRYLLNQAAVFKLIQAFWIEHFIYDIKVLEFRCSRGEECTIAEVLSETTHKTEGIEAKNLSLWNSSSKSNGAIRGRYRPFGKPFVLYKKLVMHQANNNQRYRPFTLGTTALEVYFYFVNKVFKNISNIIIMLFSIYAACIYYNSIFLMYLNNSNIVFQFYM